MSEQDDGVLVYFRDGPWNGRVERFPDARDRWLIPHSPELHGAFYYGTSLGPMPQPAIYQRAYPREYERVLAADVIAKKGTRLKDIATPWDDATVFECVFAGGY